MPTLTVEINETLNINGKNRGNSVRVDVASVSEVIERVVQVGTSEIEVLLFNGTRGAGQLADSTLQYLRITNTATSGTCDLRFSDDDGSKDSLIRIGAGESYLAFNSQIDAKTGNDAGGVIALSDMTAVQAKASTNIDLEIVAVST